MGVDEGKQDPAQRLLQEGEVSFNAGAFAAVASAQPEDDGGARQIGDRLRELKR